jgi:uncharacterized protein YdaU (DUF1376 family)
MKDPAFLFYTSDFMTGISDLTMEERGQYITLLCLQYQKGHLSKKTIRLNVANLSDDVFKKFIKDDNGLYFNNRLQIEIEKRAVFVGSRRQNGKLGGRPKAQKEKPLGKPKRNRKGNLPENVNVNVNEIENYFNENGYSLESANKFFNYYSKRDWKDSNDRPVKNWKLKAQEVWFTEENKVEPIKSDGDRSKAY